MKPNVQFVIPASPGGGEERILISVIDGAGEADELLLTRQEAVEVVRVLVNWIRPDLARDASVPPPATPRVTANSTVAELAQAFVDDVVMSGGEIFVEVRRDEFSSKEEECLFLQLPNVERATRISNRRLTEHVGDWLKARQIALNQKQALAIAKEVLGRAERR